MMKFSTIVLLYLSIPLFAQDIVPPQLTSLSVSPTIVNVVDGPDTVIIKVKATDNLSPLSTVAISVVSPNGYHDANGNATFESGSLIDSIECPIPIAEFSESGDWHIDKIYIFDEAGNYTDIGIFELQLLNMLLTFSVVSNQDILPPTLAGIVFTPPAIDVTTGTDSLSFTLNALDDISGLTIGSMTLKSPTQAHEVYAHFVFEGGNSETVEGKIGFEPFAESGIWKVDLISLTDVIGNETRLNNFALQIMGFPLEIVVTSVQDITAPTLAAFAFDPPIVDGSAGTEKVSFTVGAFDDVSGLSQVSIVLSSPSEDAHPNAYAFFDEGALAATVTTEIEISEFTELGLWIVDYVYVRDVIGNDKTYKMLDLQMWGFPYMINVIDNTIPTPTGIEEALPVKFSLKQNYPNPFNPSTNIEYQIPEAMNIEINLYDLLGKKVKTIYEGYQTAGVHTLLIDMGNLTSGVYFYELKANDFRDIKKCLLLR